MALTLRVHRLDPDLPLPAYQTAGAPAFDFSARVDVTIAPKTVGFIPVGFRVEIPEGYALILAPRSSTPTKVGLHIPHGIGIIDQDYREELLFQYYNPGDAPVTVVRGQRIGQGMVVPIERVTIEEVDELSPAERLGGFGSTGHF